MELKVGDRVKASVNFREPITGTIQDGILPNDKLVFLCDNCVYGIPLVYRNGEWISSDLRRGHISSLEHC